MIRTRKGKAISPEDLMWVCVEAAKAAGLYARLNERRRREILKATAHDVKLALDVECQKRAEEVIRAHWRDHAILGEEGSGTGCSEGPVWIIDPLDGTVNFMHGLPNWCSAVAAQVQGRVVAGAVYMPVLQELYAACEGKPALLNGEPIAVSSTTRLEESLVLTGLSKHLGNDPAMLRAFEMISMRVQKTRLMGAAAVDLCSVAAGRAEGYFESSIHIWDVAAAGLIVERAGGRTEVLERLDNVRLRYLATNGHIHEQLKACIEQALRESSRNPQ